MSTREPEFPRPSAGDELLIVRRATRYREQEIEHVRVRSMARFKIVLEGPDLPWRSPEWDIRTRAPWDNTPKANRVGSGPGVKLHTAETWAWQQRADAVDRYLGESGVHMYSLRGTLRAAASADPVGFANALRRFEGREEL